MQKFAKHKNKLFNIGHYLYCLISFLNQKLGIVVCTCSSCIEKEGRGSVQDCFKFKASMEIQVGQGFVVRSCLKNTKNRDQRELGRLNWDLQHSLKNNMAPCAHNLHAGKQRQEDSWGFPASQSSQISELQVQ